MNDEERRQCSFCGSYDVLAEHVPSGVMVCWSCHVPANRLAESIGERQSLGGRLRRAFGI